MHIGKGLDKGIRFVEGRWDWGGSEDRLGDRDGPGQEARAPQIQNGPEEPELQGKPFDHRPTVSEKKGVTKCSVYGTCL